MKNLINFSCKVSFLATLFLITAFETRNNTTLATCYTKDGYIAAISEKYLEQAIRYANDKDNVAFQKLLDAKVIVAMKKGIKVFIVDTHILAGKVEFRLEGDTNVFWTVTEALDC